MSADTTLQPSAARGTGNKTTKTALAAQQDYFKQITKRIDSYQLAYQQMAQNDTNPILVEEWYDKSINNSRIGTRRA